MNKNFFVFISIVLLINACANNSDQKTSKTDSISGDIIIFHAGSLSVPLKEIADSFKIKYPQINFLMEAAGSKACARKISDLNKPCDIMASADYNVIEQLLIPEHAEWCIKFAHNEMCIVYTEKSKFADKINQNNWYEILQHKDVIYGRSDPDSDPCGVRSILTIKLSEIFYKQQNLTNNLLSKDLNYIRPKETDLISLLETNAIDYIFLYRSVAEQHHLKYLVLPDSINLKKAELADFYATVSIQTVGKTPKERITEKGEPMVYGITIPKNSQNTKAAILFLEFLLSDKGMIIMTKNGQPSAVPSFTSSFKNIPDTLKIFARDE